MSGEFAGLRTESIQSHDVRVEFLAERCLRIVRVTVHGGKENVFAELGDVAVTTPLGRYNFYGGHRLWCAPESYPGSFQPDDVGVSVERSDGRVQLTEDRRPGADVRKSVELRIDPAGARVSVRHRVENVSEGPVELALWGITQLPLGGLTLLPQGEPAAAEKNEVLPNRNLVLWPYVAWGDPRLEVTQDWVIVHATPADRPFKVGYLNNAGWAGYLRNGTLFVKRCSRQRGKPLVDLSCNTEAYSCDRFAELESLGPLTCLQPGESATHDEAWEFYTGLRQPTMSQELRDILRPLAL